MPEIANFGTKCSVLSKVYNAEGGVKYLYHGLSTYTGDNPLAKAHGIPVEPVWPHTFVSPSAFSRRAFVSYWRKYVHEVLVNRLGGLSLPRKSVVRLAA